MWSLSGGPARPGQRQGRSREGLLKGELSLSFTELRRGNGSGWQIPGEGMILTFLQTLPNSQRLPPCTWRTFCFTPMTSICD